MSQNACCTCKHNTVMGNICCSEAVLGRSGPRYQKHDFVQKKTWYDFITYYKGNLQPTIYNHVCVRKRLIDT